MPVAYVGVICEKTRNVARLDEHKKILPAIVRASRHGRSRRTNVAVGRRPAEGILQPTLAKGEDGVVECFSRGIPGVDEAGSPRMIACEAPSRHH